MHTHTSRARSRTVPVGFCAAHGHHSCAAIWRGPDPDVKNGGHCNKQCRANAPALTVCEVLYARDFTAGYSPGSSEELGWLGHFAKKSTDLETFGMCGRDIFQNCSEESVDRFFEDLGK